ncbi:circularly permuted type 2 ATP-grasp protein [Piscinibacter koreensis]|uniref:Circularly permuted type 2 ATP-grasp protein n=1 Tax=Piscinibacter koreensis TaxID=2742824 RepID=A0A7Y6TVG2_9BURK|nr:circularly permuted type 2 ATP-grasp protein [Schlegelella koreensis]NUZ05015.1 circularly permuted type 2 ATP-grasp protein [Schlegelella koreensis]
MLKSLLDGYSALPGRYDELLAAPGKPRPQWEAFLRGLDAPGRARISDTLALTESQIREQGITYNVYNDAKGIQRPWEVDPLPLILGADEWEHIEAAIAQRADLLNRVLADIYGPQELLRSGAIPPPVIFGHRGFLHPVLGTRPPGGLHLLQYAADLARSPNGHWWVVSDRTQAPSGAGYALENRLVVSRVFPQLFRQLPVQHLASFFEAFRDALLNLAPRGDGPPLIALLTPGPYNETYFEHTLLARYLGFTLVEGTDLTVRDDRVWLKTIDGLRRVHAIVRRQDDDYCDPLELRSDSALGVPGLTDCARRGNVLLANALGSGVLESGALLGYLPKLSRRLLREELLMPSVATWWLGEPAALADAWRRLDKLIVKPLERSADEPPVFAADLTSAQREELRARVTERPHRYVAQEWVHVSQAPVLERGDRESFAARTVGLRVFAVATPNGWRVMPGGLTRVAGNIHSRVIAMQRGGRSKDTWVLSDGPVNSAFTLLTSTVSPEDLAASRPAVASRSAENLFWFGRYAERCEATLRLLRAALTESVDVTVDPASGPPPAALLAARLGLIDGPDAGAPALLAAATARDGAMHAHLDQLARVAFTLRDRMSTDHWRTLNQLTRHPVFRRPATLPQALLYLDRAITATMTASGFVLDGMMRGIGWRFLSIGRRLERVATLCGALQVAIDEGAAHGLDWLLDLADSTVSYRSRYPVAPEWLPVLDMLVRDETNPRSLAFQVKGLTEFVAKLEVTHGRFASDLLTPAQSALHALRADDLRPESVALRRLLGQLQRGAFELSDRLSLKFFAHAEPRSVMSLVA